MEADTGLIENIKNAAKPRADLRGEANALGFAAGKRGRGTIQAKVAEAHGEQKIDAFRDFFERARGDFLLAFGELGDHLVHSGPRGAKRKGGEIGDGPPSKLDGQRFGT